MLERLYSALVKRDDDAESALPAEVRRDVPRNGLRLVAASALQSSGDQTVNASTVLPWLFHALGVPPVLIGLLVPIRESGSMLPQAMLTPVVLRLKHRKHVFAAGSLVQAAAVGAMALAAATMHGLAAGATILVALAVFSLGRCLCSISSKDVQGRTVPKGERGQINGLSTTAAGLVAITLGVAIRVAGGSELDAGELAWLLVVGVVMWVGAALLYMSVREPADEHSDEESSGARWLTTTWQLLRDDAPFRNFVLVRSLLLVSALSPPFVVSLSVGTGSQGLAGLGGFVIASGVAALLGGRIFGRWADRSSRSLMSFGAAAASAVIVVLVIAVSLPGFDGSTWWGTGLFVLGYFLLTMLHTGVRVGRKTYVVDMAEGDQRTTYVAVSNSAMGIILLIVGAVSSALAALGIPFALLFLAAMGVVGVFAGARLPDVSRG